MRFGKLVLVLFLLAVGAVLLAGHLGYLRVGIWPGLTTWWPLLLLFAFLAALFTKRLRNFIVGILAVAVVLVCVGFGVHWISRETGMKAKPTTVVDLSKPPVRSISLRGRTLIGSVTVDDEPMSNTKLLWSARAITGHEVTAHRWTTSSGTGVLEWPDQRGLREAVLLGSTFRALLPRQARVRLNCSNWFASTTADFSGLSPERCEMRAIGSSVRIGIGPARPRQIHVRGFLSNVVVHLPPNCPARIEYSSPLTLRSFPSDFLEQAGVHVKGKVAHWVAPGSGAPVRIVVDGHFMRLRVVREPLRMARAGG